MNTNRTANLASTLEDVLTVTLRVRYRVQPVADVVSFRREMRLLLRQSTELARSLGYTGLSVQRAIFAVVALLDESILNLQDPTFGDWSRRPLQEELFGGHLAGETFYEHLRACLQSADSVETADVLEVHCLCLLLGYRGRYAFGGDGAIEALLRQARDTIRRLRGSPSLTPATIAPVLPQPAADRFSQYLLWAAIIAFVCLVLAWIAYSVVLSSGVHVLSRALSTLLEFS